MRQMPSTVSSGNRPSWRRAMARIMEASRPGRKAEPPPCFSLMAMSVSMMRLRSIKRPCMAASIRSMLTRRSFNMSSGRGSAMGGSAERQESGSV